MASAGCAPSNMQRIEPSYTLLRQLKRAVAVKPWATTFTLAKVGFLSIIFPWTTCYVFLAYPTSVRRCWEVLIDTHLYFNSIRKRKNLTTQRRRRYDRHCRRGPRWSIDLRFSSGRPLCGGGGRVSAVGLVTDPRRPPPCGASVSIELNWRCVDRWWTDRRRRRRGLLVRFDWLIQNPPLPLAAWTILPDPFRRNHAPYVSLFDTS
jgi:hypothetical protein